MKLEQSALLGWNSDPDHQVSQGGHLLPLLVVHVERMGLPVRCHLLLADLQLVEGEAPVMAPLLLLLLGHVVHTEHWPVLPGSGAGLRPKGGELGRGAVNVQNHDSGHVDVVHNVPQVLEGGVMP